MKLPQVIQTKYQKHPDGFYWGTYQFFPLKDNQPEFPPSQELPTLAPDFLPLALTDSGAGLALYQDQDQLVYKFDPSGELAVFSSSDQELIQELDRSELWLQISEGIAPTRDFALNVTFQKKDPGQQAYRLCFTTDQEDQRQHAFIYRTEVKSGQLLQDVLKQELEDQFDLTKYQLEDIVDFGDYSQQQQTSQSVPVFTAEIIVQELDVNQLLPGENNQAYWAKLEN